jgi:hypothetical protein
MKIFRVGGYMTLGKDSETYHFVIQRWSLRKYYKAKLYHCYDMRIPKLWYKLEPKLPGYGMLMERKLKWYERPANWSINQDFKCHELNRQHDTIAEIEVSKATYKLLFR